MFEHLCLFVAVGTCHDELMFSHFIKKQKHW